MAISGSFLVPACAKADPAAAGVDYALRIRAMRGRFLLPILLVLAGLAEGGASHARAVTTLHTLAEGKGEVERVEDLSLDVAGQVVPARMYHAARGANAPGIVLCHGIHRLGIDEPRLGRFSRALATSGINVLTPRIDALTDYRIDAASVPTIDVAARALATRLGRSRVGVMGFSFAGGLALVAASRPDTSRAIGLVVAVGAHDELARVTRFFGSGQTTTPDGRPFTMTPHEYGPLVLAYGAASEFFDEVDVPIARDAMRLKLWEKHDEAKREAEKLSPPGRERWEQLVSGNRAAVAPILERLAARHEATFRAASPHGKLADVRVPVFLLHGAGDSVIPPSETLWLASQVGPERLRDSLVSPIIQHVELHGEPSLLDRFRIVHFLSGVLTELDLT